MVATAEAPVAPASAPSQRHIYTNRLKAGRHIDNDADTGKPRIWDANTPGHNVVRSHIDLAKRWPEKFEKMDEGATANVDPETVMRPGETLNDFANRMQELSRVRSGGNTQLTSSPVTPAKGTDLSTFDAMTVAELRVYADAEEIALGNAKSKEDIVKLVKAHHGG